MNRKFSSRQRTAGYTPKHIFALCAGVDFFRDVFGRGNDTAGEIEAMRQAWPILKDACIELNYKKRGFDSLPLAFYLFDKDCPQRYRLKYLDERIDLSTNRPFGEAKIVKKLRAAGLLPMPKDETKTETL